VGILAHPHSAPTSSWSRAAHPAMSDCGEINQSFASIPATDVLVSSRAPDAVLGFLS
jgi:hypothetical protein